MLKIIQDFCQKHNDKVRMLDSTEDEKVQNFFFENFVFNQYTINWDKYPEKMMLTRIDEFQVISRDSRCYFITDSQNVPIIETTFDFFINHLSTFSNFSFDSWIVDLEFKWLIENHHEKGLIFTKVNNLSNKF